MEVADIFRDHGAAFALGAVGVVDARVGHHSPERLGEGAQERVRPAKPHANGDRQDRYRARMVAAERGKRPLLPAALARALERRRDRRPGQRYGAKHGGGDKQPPNPRAIGGASAERIAQERSEHHSQKARRSQGADDFRQAICRRAKRDIGRRGAEDPGHAGRQRNPQREQRRTIGPHDQQMPEATGDKQ